MAVKREPPTCKPWDDPIASECGITPVSFGIPIPPDAWCHYCEYPAQARDHVVPDSVKGARAWWNLVPACHNCNLGKADRQSCACKFCLRALALWHLGFRRTGTSYRDRKNYRKNRDRELEVS